MIIKPYPMLKPKVIAYRTLAEALKDREPMFMLFQSFGSGGHYNTAVQGLKALWAIIELHAKTSKLMRELPSIQAKFEQWSGDVDYEAYSDAWFGFGDGSWVTVTYDPQIQVSFIFPMNDHHKTRNEKLFTGPDNDEPRFVRCYENTHNKTGQPKKQWIKGVEFWWTVLYTGITRTHLKKTAVGDGWLYSQYDRDGRCLGMFAHPHTPERRYHIDIRPPRRMAFPYNWYNKDLGRRLQYQHLPAKVKLDVMRRYTAIWPLHGGHTVGKRSARATRIGEMRTPEMLALLMPTIKEQQ